MRWFVLTTSFSFAYNRLVSATTEDKERNFKALQRKWLEEKSKENGVVKLHSGLMYKVLTKRVWKFHPTVNSRCLCHYEVSFSL